MVQILQNNIWPADEERGTLQVQCNTDDSQATLDLHKLLVSGGTYQISVKVWPLGGYIISTLNLLATLILWVFFPKVRDQQTIGHSEVRSDEFAVQEANDWGSSPWIYRLLNPQIIWALCSAAEGHACPESAGTNHCFLGWHFQGKENTLSRKRKHSRVIPGQPGITSSPQKLILFQRIHSLISTQR